MKIPKIKRLKEEINNSCPIELYGNKRVIIFDCKSVVDYSNDFIVLDLGGQVLRICGANLVADSFVFGQTDITGEIISLEFVQVNV